MRSSVSRKFCAPGRSVRNPIRTGKTGLSALSRKLVRSLPDFARKPIPSLGGWSRSRRLQPRAPHRIQSTSCPIFHGSVHL